MSHARVSTLVTSSWHVLLACMLLSFVQPLHAALTNKYTFNDGTANDSAGFANGTLVDNTGIASFVGGTIDLSNNNNANSNQDFTDPATVGAFVNLPNGTFTSAVTGGVFGQVSLEVWATVQQNHTWAELYSFGTSNAGEDSSGGAGSSDYVALIPQSGPNDFRATTHASAGDPIETPIIGSATPLTTNQKHHIVLTLDQFDTAAGPNGTANLYLDNGAPVSAEIRPFLDLMIDNNNWLGRSQWPDNLFDGLIDEFSIYDTVLSASEVSNNFAAGPEAATLPVLFVNRNTGQITIENQTGSGIQIKGYSIDSDAGSLNPAAWTSIDAGNTFDPNGTWTAQSSTEFRLEESNTGGTLDGGTLPGNSSQSIGTPWVRTPFEDLQFNFTLGDDSVGAGLVQYTGTVLKRSDLNADGNIDADDWALFVPNSFTAFPDDSDVVAYFKGDLDRDHDNDYHDFKLFKTDFIAENGQAAFDALIGAVPEPNAIVLIGVAAATLTSFRHKSTSQFVNS